jgi:hypothetical protein
MNPIQNPSVISSKSNRFDFYLIYQSILYEGTCPKCYDTDFSRLIWQAVANRDPVTGKEKFPPRSIYADEAAGVNVVSSKPGRIDIFYLGIDGKIRTIHGNYIWPTNFINYSPLDEKILGGHAPAGAKVTVWGPWGHIFVGYTGSDEHVHIFIRHLELKENDDWTTFPEDMHGDFPPGSPVTLIMSSPSGLDLFVVGHNGDVYYTGPYSAGSSSHLDWKSIGQPSAGIQQRAPVTAISRKNFQIDLFVVGNDEHVYTNGRSNDNWMGWHDIGGTFPPGSPVSVQSLNQERLDAFVVGFNGEIYWSHWPDDRWWSGVGNNWTPIGQPKAGVQQRAPLTVISRKVGQIDLFVCALDGAIYRSEFSLTQGGSTVWTRI